MIRLAYNFYLLITASTSASIIGHAHRTRLIHPKHKETKRVKRPKPNLINGSNTSYTNNQAEKHGNNWNRWYHKKYGEQNKCSMINENRPDRKSGQWIETQNVSLEAQEKQLA